MNITSFPLTAHIPNPGAACPSSARIVASVVIVLAFIAAIIGPAVAAAASPAAGDTFVYRVINGYNNEARGQIRYRIDKVDADRIVVLVTTDNPALGPARTEVYTKEGNWLRHPVINHDQPVEYEFAQAYPAYVLPLDSGNSWSMRVNATDPASGRRNSVRVDGAVLGSERISTPAGVFDTIKVRRRVYAGDWDGFRFETNITETDWYAPALGRAARMESNSSYMHPERCGDQLSACTPIRGDWHVFELLEASTAKP